MRAAPPARIQHPFVRTLRGDPSTGSETERARTIEKHRHNLDRHLLPRFEQRKLADITPPDVARVVADMQRADEGGIGALLGDATTFRTLVAIAPSSPASSASTGSRLGTRLPTTTSS